MSVYVDDMYKYSWGRYGRMKMSHMTADTLSELNAMADKIGIKRKWIQYPDKPKRCHYDIGLGKRKLAIENGAVEISMRELAFKVTDLEK